MTKIEKALKQKGKIVLGRERCIRLLKKGKLSEVFMASNFRGNKEVKEIAEVKGAGSHTLKYTNEELGSLCKKPFSVSIIGLYK